MMKKKTNTSINKARKIPHTFVILFSVMILVSILTYLITPGEYDRVEDPVSGRTVVDPNSYTEVEKTPVNLFGVFTSIPKGMTEAAQISFFIFIIAGAFQIINSTGAIEQLVLKITKSFRGREAVMIPVIMFVFSLSGAFFGFSEEHLVFVPIIIALSRALGYDAIVGMALITVGGNIGFNAAMMNPFNVGIAQGIAELPLFSGIGLRFAAWAVFYVVSVYYVLRYAKKVKNRPESSLVVELESRER
jgi:uncharacterized ion transporter superfamily protein YfcC